MSSLHRNRTLQFAAVLVAAACAALPTLAADRNVNETRKVDADARITIENMAGEVEVTGWDRKEVSITGTLDPKADELSIEGGGKSLHIEVKYPHKRNLNIDEGSHLTLKVPQGCELRVETVSADVKVSDLTGDVRLASVSGDIDAQGKFADLNIETVSGDLDVEATAKRCTFSTVSGEIDARGLGREVTTSSVSGDVTLEAGDLVTELRVETVSGEVEVQASPAKDADWKVSSQSGDVDLWLSAKVDAEFDIETFSGDIRDGFGHEAERTSRFAPGQELKFTQGSGGAEITVNAFSGDVTIRRK